MYEVYLMCDAMPGMEITTCDCNDQCERCGCSNCTAADDAELLINQGKSIFDFEETNDHGSKKGKIPESEIDMILKEIKQELN